MNDTARTAIHKEMEQFRSEKDKIRDLIGQIGGRSQARRSRVANVVFFVAIITLFSVDFLRHSFGIPIPIPALFSIELGILLVSLKIIWMIHNQAKVEHFQFWMLNSIEFRLNGITKKLGEIEKRLRFHDPVHPPEGLAD